MKPETIDILIKALLTIFGAVIGLALKIFSDEYRLHALLPIVTKQLEAGISISARAYSAGEAKQAEILFDTVFRSLTDLIALGARPRKAWQKGAELLFDATLAARTVSGLEGAAAVRALEQLRARATKLEAWVKERK